MTLPARAFTRHDTSAWDPLEVWLDRISERIGRRRMIGRRSHATWLARAWLSSSGVTCHGEVPADVMTWMEWASGMRSALARANLPWRFLTLDGALDVRITLQSTRGAPAGAWLPLVVGADGDHQIYLPCSPRSGAVTCWYRDEPASSLGAVHATPLVEFARALVAAWPT